MEVVESGEDGVELVATPDVVVIVPKVGTAGEDVQLEACNDAEIVACALHAP